MADAAVLDRIAVILRPPTSSGPTPSRTFTPRRRRARREHRRRPRDVRPVSGPTVPTVTSSVRTATPTPSSAVPARRRGAGWDARSDRLLCRGDRRRLRPPAPHGNAALRRSTTVTRNPFIIAAAVTALSGLVFAGVAGQPARRAPSRRRPRQLGRSQPTSRRRRTGPARRGQVRPTPHPLPYEAPHD